MIYYRPCGDFSKAPTPRDGYDKDLYNFLAAKTGLAITVDPSVDYEDWMEPATLLAAALRMDLETTILPRKPLKDAIASPLATVDGKPCPDILIGRTLVSDGFDAKDFAWPPKNGDMINHYGELATFAKYAGRKVQLAHFPGEQTDKHHPFLGKAAPGMDIDAALKNFGDTVIIKQVWPAKAFHVFEAKNDGRPGWEVLMDEMEYHAARFEGEQDALLIQDKITMRFETRLFVYKGQVMTGSGVIESHTPQQSTGCVVNPFFEETRNDGTRLVNHDLANDYFEAAQLVVDEIKEECGLDTYVIDVALDEDDDIIVIELNPIAQAGLYGANADLLMEGIMLYANSEL